MVWPATTSRQRVFLVKCPRAQLGQENYQKFGDVSFDLVTSWKRKGATADSSGAAAAASRDDVVVIEARNAKKQKKEPKVGSFFHFCFTDDSSKLSAAPSVKSVVQGCTTLVCPWCNFCPGARGEQLGAERGARAAAPPPAAPLFSPGGGAVSPGNHLKERHNVRLGPSFQVGARVGAGAGARARKRARSGERRPDASGLMDGWMDGWMD
jgi:hypothetical protein